MFIHNIYHQKYFCVNIYIYVYSFWLELGSFSSPTALPSSSLSASQPQPMAHLGSQGTNGRHGLVGSAPRISELEKTSPSDRQVPMGFCPGMAVSHELYISIHRLCLRLHFDIWWWEKCVALLLVEPKTSAIPTMQIYSVFRSSAMTFRSWKIIWQFLFEASLKCSRIFETHGSTSSFPSICRPCLSVQR